MLGRDEVIFGRGIRRRVGTDDMQFAFMRGRRTTGTVFIVRRMRQRFGARGGRLCFGFVDLERAFGGVPREVVGWAVCGLGVSGT